MSASKSQQSRREFIAKSTLSLASAFLISKGWSFPLAPLQKPNSKVAGVQIGVITYSYRGMPGDIVQILKYITDSGISAVELMGDAVEDFAGKPASPAKPGQARPSSDVMSAYNKQVAEWRASVGMEKFKEVKSMFDKAGVEIYAFKPNALNAGNTDAEVEYALKAAKALGAKSVTVELSKDAAHSKRLGDLGAKHKVYIGYHAHTQATDTAWDTALSQSPYNSMNLDCGHYIAAGGNNTTETLLRLIEAKHDRITSMHIKDRKNAANGGANVSWGEGDTPLKQILGLMKQKQYKFPATIELEYPIPAGSDAVAEVKKSFEYAKKAIG